MRQLCLASALAIAGMTFTTAPAEAAVYCKYVGVPKGCVAKPGVVYRPAPGVGVPGTPVNRGGPVNRVGRR